MADIPPPLITEILTKLPVKSLLRFRSVSKTWQSIIDSHYFITLHLQRSLINQTLIIKDYFINDDFLTNYTNYPFLYSVDYPTLYNSTLINNPFHCDSFRTEIIGSCNGLLCFADGKTMQVFLYNPATKKHRVLPFSDVDFDRGMLFFDRIMFGFGYDHVNDDYKVVRIVQIYAPNNDFHASEVKVFSLKTNSWRKVGDFPGEYYISYDMCWGGYVNGCLNWVVNLRPVLDNCQLIVGFDFVTEEFGVVPQPNYDDRNSDFFIKVGVLEGCLMVMSICPKMCTDIWVMKEYGVKGSWSKLVSIPQLGCIGVFESLEPIAYSKKGGREEVLIVQDFKKLVWVDLKRRTARVVNTPGLPEAFDAVLVVESLVSLESHSKKKMRKTKMKRNEQLGDLSSRLANLPLVLLYNILSRLPAMTLWQFRLVCKEWNTLIHEPNFARLHIEVSGKSNDNLNLIIREEKLHIVDCNVLNRVVPVNNPLSSPEGWTIIEGSCNGLLCLSNQNNDIALWNPLTGGLQKLPFFNSHGQMCSHGSELFIYGFGYDFISNDYKIVQILQRYYNIGYEYGEYVVMSPDSDDFAGSEVFVYSTKAKCWRKIDCFPYIICLEYPGILANGALHWVARRRCEFDSASHLLLAFDLGLEKCRIVQQPNYDNIHFHMSLGVLEGSLCILCHYPKHGVDIWVMKDYEKWCKLISITQPRPIKYFEYIKPLVYSKNCSEVLLVVDFEKFIWYNLQKKTIRHVNIHHLPKEFGTEVLSGSLLDPNNVDALSESNHMESNGTKNLRHKNQSGSTPKKMLQQRKSSIILATFPEKVLCHIFCRLPVKDLLQVQRVCKTWYNLINGSEFIKMHLEAIRQYNSGLFLILKGNNFLLVNVWPLGKVIDIKHPLLCDEQFSDIVGSCNGLICLCSDHNLAVWNPWTGNCEKIPPLDLCVDHAFCYFIHGFGYDPTTNDYKVVSIRQHHNQLKGGTVHTEIQVYNLKTKTWKRIEQFPYFICNPCSGVFTGGALHWVARQSPDLYSSSNLLIAFDLGVEKCRLVAQPNYVDTDFHMSLSVLGGNLCFLCHYPKKSVDLWVMTNSKTESWTKLVSILQPNIIRHFEYMKPLAYSDDSSEVLFEQDNEKLLWYNLMTKTAKYAKIKGLPKAFGAVVCTGSLVPVGKATRFFQVIDKKPPKGLQDTKNKKERNDLDGFLTKGFKLKL